MPSLKQALAGYQLTVTDLDDRRFYGRETLSTIIDASPALKANIELALARGDMRGFSFDKAELAGAGGSYNSQTGLVDIPRGAYRNSAEMVFVLGHETQHALSLRAQPEQPYMTRLKQDIDAVQAPHVPPRLHADDPDPRVQPSPHGAPRDYTQAVAHYVEGVRAEEAQAHIGGFNALVSYVARKNHGAVPTPQDLYEALPGRMGDFIERRGVSPNETYQMKAGLTRAEDGTLAFTPQNVEAMKHHYADKFPGSFGENGLLDYRHQAIQTAWKVIQHSEADITRTASFEHQRDFYVGRTPGYVPVDNAYRIDFAALGTNPAVMRFPSDGLLRTVDSFAGHKALDDIGAPGNDPRRARIDDSIDLTRNAVRDSEQATRLLREQGVLPSTFGQSVSRLFHSAINGHDPDDPVPNRAQAPMQVPQPVVVEPALLTQARDALGLVSGAGDLGDRVRFENVAAALALQAKHDGFDRIDQVLMSTHGDKLIAVQGQDPGAPESRHAVVEIAQAAQQPAQQNTQLLQQAMLAQADAPVPQQQVKMLM